MIGFVILSLIYGPIAVTLGCWLFFQLKQAGQMRKRLFVFSAVNSVAFIGAPFTRHSIVLA